MCMIPITYNNHKSFQLYPFFTVVCGTAVFIFVTVFRNQLPYIFTSEA